MDVLLRLIALSLNQVLSLGEKKNENEAYSWKKKEEEEERKAAVEKA